MPTAHVIGLALAAAHVVLVAFVIRLVLRSREPDWPMLWGLLIVVNFPWSLVLAAVGSFVGKVHSEGASTRRVLDIHNFVVPFVLLGVGGTVWWYALPQVFAWLYRSVAGATSAF
jgi:uncharacterized membrane protein (UPF0136 family)